MRWVGLLVVLIACEPKYPHVTLPRPAPDLTPEQRVSTFQALLPKQATISEVTKCSGKTSGSCSYYVNEGVVLANGADVHYPEDLRPLVAPNSETSYAIDDKQTEHTRTLFFGITGTAALFGGGIWLVSTDGAILSTADPARIFGGGALVVAGLIGIALSYKHYDAYMNENRHAYAAYPHDLAATLRVCVDGLYVVPCETVSSPH